MLCFIKPIIENTLFTLENDLCFLNVLNQTNNIDIKLLITIIALLQDTYKSITISIDKKLPSNEKIKIILLKNYFNELKYIIN